MIKVFVIDDHSVVRTGLKLMLPLDGDIEVVGDSSGGEDAAQKALAAQPDVILLDIRMPVKDGLKVLSEILMWKPEAKVIMLTTSEADNHVYESLKRGAKGYILKDRDSDEIAKAVRTVADGGKFIPQAVKDLYETREMKGGLKAREVQVLTFVRRGLKSEKIGEELGISAEGVKMHVRNILAKLEVPDRASAISEAVRRGFLPE